MAENKKSFIAYADWKGMFEALPDEIAGKLIKHVFAYVNDENPITDNFIINALFEQIKSTLKRDLVKWESQREQRSLAGKISAERRSTKSNERSTTVNETVRNPTVSVNVSVNDNDTVNDKMIYKTINHLSITFSDFEKLKKEFNEKDILDCFDRIENYKENTKYTSLFLTSKQWLQKQKNDNEKRKNGNQNTRTAQPTSRPHR